MLFYNLSNGAHFPDSLPSVNITDLFNLCQADEWNRMSSFLTKVSNQIPNEFKYIFPWLAAICVALFLECIKNDNICKVKLYVTCVYAYMDRNK